MPAPVGTGRTSAVAGPSVNGPATVLLRSAGADGVRLNRGGPGAAGGDQRGCRPRRRTTRERGSNRRPHDVALRHAGATTYELRAGRAGGRRGRRGRPHSRVAAGGTG